MIPEEAAKLIGKTAPPVIFEVEKGAIKRYADAIADRNPLYWDDEYARNSKYGAIIAPPGFFGWPTQWANQMPLLPPTGIRTQVLDTLSKLGFPRILDGGVEYEFNAPVRAGDKLVGSAKVADIFERESKGTKMMFSVIETTYFTLNGTVAFKMRQTSISR